MPRRLIPLSARLAALALVATLAACAHHGHHGPAGQAVSILEPADGATVSSPFKLRFGVQGLAVAPAGDVVAHSGHHHLLINVGPLAAGESVPFTDRHLHFGKGQTETEVSLPPGTYKLTAQFANGAHQSYGPGLSRTITVTVK
ncbi:MAG: DUF4399 domain-containing protein [Pseudomonadota bacterium]